MDFANYCLNTICTDYIQSKKFKKNTHVNYLYTLKEFFHEYPKYEDFSHANCSAYLDFLLYQKEQKYSTVVKKKKQLSSFFNFVKDNLDRFDEIPPEFVNHFMYVCFPEEPEIIHINRIISLSDLDTLITYLYTHNISCLVAVLFAFKLMLRTSEFISLQWRDILEVADGSLIRLPDGTSYRYIVLPEDIFKFLMSYRNYTDYSAYILPSPFNQDIPISQKSLRHYLKNAVEAVGIPYFTFNDLRNAGISYAVLQDCPLDLIIEQLNYKSRSHVARLTSVSSLTFPNASDFTSVVFTGDEKRSDRRVERSSASSDELLNGHISDEDDN